MLQSKHLSWIDMFIEKYDKTWYTVTLYTWLILALSQNMVPPNPMDYHHLPHWLAISGTRQNELSIGLWLDPNFPWLNRLFSGLYPIRKKMGNTIHQPDHHCLYIPLHPHDIPIIDGVKPPMLVSIRKNNPLRMLKHSQSTRFHNFHYINLASLQTSMFTILMIYSHPGVGMELSIQFH
jgi:hypothetical protein